MPRQSMPAGPGRPKGLPNKATQKAREAIAMFVEGNVDRLNGWLDSIATKDPQKAFDSFMSVVEYHIPKLARAEQVHTGADGGPVKSEITVKFIDTNTNTDSV